ncbi:flagellar motor stator protein MotA [Ferrimonas balearica]|uniref:flagellar motor stator protein MotA n=1 Tax=Ferrimonas balearica TaxID=44012 RepID=UPI001C99EB3E|nr:flagellar motor stator protein MotA [Ferrimonas balearica]MBY5920036.1 flagellar motor stator protein MotA [Ferrimonas balearica]MBY5997279.1 flagellar motor stator protein MotA [Ferrimonas balearica]
MLKFFGLLTVIASVFGGFLLAKGQLAALWQPAEVLIVMGAAIGSYIISNPMPVLRDTLSQLKGIVSYEKEDPELYPQLFGLMNTLMGQIRSNGLKVLDEHIEKPFESSIFLTYPAVLRQPMLLSFLIDNLRLQSMGKLTSHEFQHLMDEEIHRLQEDRMRPSHAMHRTGEALPGFGILAAVMGIIITMGAIDGPLTMIGVHVAAALVGTFMGVFACYCLFEPAASAMAHLIDRKIAQLHCVKAIMVAQVAGKQPLLALDAGRRLIQEENRPTFLQLERYLSEEPR